jgi:hypothetical protein
MYDKVISLIVILPCIAWGVISFIKPEFAFKYTFGNILRHQKPSKYFIINYKISGVAGVAFGIYILFRVFTGRF